MSRMKKLFIFVILMIVFSCACTACEIPTFSTGGLLPSYTCSTCKDKKEVKCTSCRGKKETRCNLCLGTGQRQCIICMGSGYRTCTLCMGSGFTTSFEYDFFSNSYKNVRKSCYSCVGGRVTCSRTTMCGCGNGKSTCLTCVGKGSKPCPNCTGN